MILNFLESQESKFDVRLSRCKTDPTQGEIIMQKYLAEFKLWWTQRRQKNLGKCWYRYIFSLWFYWHFLRWWQGEIVEQSKASLIDDHFLYFHYLFLWFEGLYGKEKLVAGRSSRAKGLNEVCWFWLKGFPYFTLQPRKMWPFHQLHTIN